MLLKLTSACALFVLLGCGAACPDPASATSAGGLMATGGESTLVDLVRGAQDRGLAKVVVRYAEDGTVQKVAVYHARPTPDAAAAQAAATERFPGSTIRGYESEHYAEHGRVLEVEVTTADGRTCEVAVLASGGVLYTECAVELANLPEAVRHAAESRVAGGSIIEAEHKEGTGIDQFSVEVEKDGYEHYLRIGADGSLLGHGLRVPAEIEIPVL